MMTNKLAADVNVTGNRLRAILVQRNLTQSGLSDKSGAGRQVISRIINGKSQIISSVTALNIAVSLGVPVPELFPNAGKR
jgi:transcriptional regulator with XRE-family HTH domain